MLSPAPGRCPWTSRDYAPRLPACGLGGVAVLTRVSTPARSPPRRRLARPAPARRRTTRRRRANSCARWLRCTPPIPLAERLVVCAQLMAMNLPGAISRAYPVVTARAASASRKCRTAPRMIPAGLAGSMTVRSPGSARTAAGSRKSAATATALSWCLCARTFLIPDTFRTGVGPRFAAPTAVRLNLG
jgi:hypothetical protein